MASPRTGTGTAGKVTLALTSSPPVAAAGGSGSFTVTLAGGRRPWFPEALDPWITVTSPTSTQETSGPVNYTAAAQAGGAPARSGRIRIANKVYTVNQQAGA